MNDLNFVPPKTWRDGQWLTEDQAEPAPVGFANTSGIKPIEFNVVVLPDKVEEKSKGGLIYSDDTLDREKFRQSRGTLVASSPMAFTYDDWPEGESPPEPGARIIFAKNAGIFVEGSDGQEYKVLKDKDIVGVME